MHPFRNSGTLLGMRRFSLVITAVMGVGCGSSKSDLKSLIRCSEDGKCPAGSSCLVDRCIDDGTVEMGETCRYEEQCGAEMTCHDYACAPGCSLVYHVDDCADGFWCKPLVDGDWIGECVHSQCDPSSAEFCATESICVAFAPTVGGCLPYCQYSIASSGAYHDLCEDEGDTINACQSLGTNLAPVCLPAGSIESPTIGQPGCHPVYNPCQPGGTCVDVVCRRLCIPGLPGACAPGETCETMGGRSDIAYCRANAG